MCHWSLKKKSPNRPSIYGEGSDCFIHIKKPGDTSCSRLAQLLLNIGLHGYTAFLAGLNEGGQWLGLPTSVRGKVGVLGGGGESVCVNKERRIL